MLCPKLLLSYPTFSHHVSNWAANSLQLTFCADNEVWSYFDRAYVIINQVFNRRRLHHTHNVQVYLVFFLFTVLIQQVHLFTLRLKLESTVQRETLWIYCIKNDLAGIYFSYGWYKNWHTHRHTHTFEHPITRTYTQTEYLTYPMHGVAVWKSHSINIDDIIENEKQSPKVGCFIKNSKGAHSHMSNTSVVNLWDDSPKKGEETTIDKRTNDLILK